MVIGWRKHQENWLISCNDYTMLLIMRLNWILQLYYWDLGVFGSINKINETRLEALFITPYFLLTYDLLSQLYLLWETLVTLDKVWYISILYTRIKKRWVNAYKELVMFTFLNHFFNRRSWSWVSHAHSYNARLTLKNPTVRQIRS